jgi:hypothetical protein
VRIAEGAVRKRVERGHLKAERTPDGRLLVYHYASATAHDSERARVHDTSRDDTTARIAELEDQIGFLREQLAVECQAHGEARRPGEDAACNRSATRAARIGCNAL